MGSVAGVTDARGRQILQFCIGRLRGPLSREFAVGLGRLAGAGRPPIPAPVPPVGGAPPQWDAGLVTPDDQDGNRKAEAFAANRLRKQPPATNRPQARREHPPEQGGITVTHDAVDRRPDQPGAQEPRAGVVVPLSRRRDGSPAAGSTPGRPLRAAPGRHDGSFTVDCADCAHRDTPVCEDCVVSFIVGRAPEDALVVDAAEARAVRLLAQAGLVPGVRHEASGL